MIPTADRRLFHRRWVALSAIGLIIGLPAGLLLGAPLEAIVGMMLVTPVAAGLSGVVLGGSQWLVLRRHFEHAGWWVLCSAVGLGLGLWIGVVLVELIGTLLTGGQVRISTVGPLSRIGSFGLIGLAGGTGLGVTQWSYLRRHRRDAHWWMPCSALGLAGAFLIASGLVELLPGGTLTPVGAITFLVLAALMAAAVTGHGLVRLAFPAVQDQN